MTNESKKRTLAMIAAAMMALSMTGCGGPKDTASSEASTDTSASTSSTETAEKEDTKKTKKVSFSYLDYTGDTSGKIPEETLVQQERHKQYKEKFGYEVEIDRQLVHMGDYREKLKVLFAGGSIPDLIHCGWFPMEDLNKYGDQGLVVNFAEHKDRMPDLFATIAKDSTYATRGFSAEGNLYQAPGMQQKPDGSYDTTMTSGFRKDILDKHGLAVPTTLDEMFDTAMALKKEYPTVYPIMTLEEWEPLARSVYAAWGVGDGVYFDQDTSKFVYGPLEDGYRQAVEYLSKLYANELIAPDYAIHTSEQGMAAVAKGEAYMIPTIWNGYPSRWKNDHPDQEWVLVPGMTNGVDKARFISHPNEDTVYANHSYYYTVSNSSKVKEELMDMLNLWYTDEFLRMEGWGIEGVSYELDENGKPYLPSKEAYLDPKVGANHPADISIKGTQLDDPTTIFYNGELREQKLYEFVREVYTEDIRDGSYKPVTLSTDENEEYANIMTAVETFAEEETAKFITGKRDFAEWDQFIEELNALGDIQKALDLKNAKL